MTDSWSIDDTDVVSVAHTTRLCLDDDALPDRPLVSSTKVQQGTQKKLKKQKQKQRQTEQAAAPI